MKTFIPPVSSRNTSMLGAAHLARLYWKLLFLVLGCLRDGYGLGAGFDAMTLKALGIPLDALNEFMKSRPSPAAFVEWIRGNATNISDEDIKAHNDAILDYNHSVEDRAAILKFCGISDTPDAPWKAALLNELDDAHTTWLDLVAANIEQAVPVPVEPPVEDTAPQSVIPHASDHTDGADDHDTQTPADRTGTLQAAAA